MSKVSPYAGVPDEELKALVALDDHEYVETDENSGEYTHAYWSCGTCAIESELESRYHARQAVKPGHCPKGVNRFHSITAEELKLGMIAQYLSRPGVSNYAHEWAEVVDITRTKKGKVKAYWRMTNAPEADTFQATYKPSEHLSVGEVS